MATTGEGWNISYQKGVTLGGRVRKENSRVFLAGPLPGGITSYVDAVVVTAVGDAGVPKAGGLLLGRVPIT